MEIFSECIGKHHEKRSPAANVWRSARSIWIFRSAGEGEGDNGEIILAPLLAFRYLRTPKTNI